MAFTPVSDLASAAGPFVVSGTVALDAATLAALETITALQGTTPWIVGGASGAALDLSTLATEDTLERVADSLDDVGLTAILQREEVGE